MVDGEVEGGLDDQLIDEAILEKKEGKERGETGRKGGLDRMMKRKVGLGDNDEACRPRLRAPGNNNASIR